MTAIRHLLKEWHEKASLLFASRFHITPIYDLGKIDFVRDTLSDSFSYKYFQLDSNLEVSHHKINWIKSLLLAADRLGAVKALYEIALLIRYCQRQPELRVTFDELKSNPTNLRSFFFELFVFRALDQAGLATVKKTVAAGQELEGHCTVRGTTFLLECKLPYMPKLEELFVIQRLIKDFHEKGQYKSPTNGYIASISLQRPVQEQHRIALGSVLDSFYAGLTSGIDAIVNERIPTDYGLFEAVSYHHETLTSWKTAKERDILYYVSPTGAVKADGAVLLEGKVTGQFNVLRSQLYKKLETILKKEKEQHPSDRFPNKILLIGSESYPEFQFGLFHDPSFFDRERVLALYHKLRLDCILVFIRKYFLQDQPSVLVDVIAPPRFELEGLLIQRIFSSLPV